MNRRVSLLFGVHAHQPVGNFPEVIEEAHARCYRPFLQTLYRYPDFRFAVHFSGWLLDTLYAQYPEDMALLGAMAARGQVEIFGAGYNEPVLAAIPYRDRLGQIDKLSQRIAQRFGRRPQGAWLTERVWDASVAPALAECGIRYVAVDDYHFLCTGMDAVRLDGYYTTEEDDHRLDLFPISEALRYRIPFHLADEVVAYLEGMAGRSDAAAVYFDDIEKFGIWPETYQWVYEEKWLTRFIEGVLASPKIKTCSYRDYHARAATRGIVYLPTTSYVEMNEWTLPAPAAQIYADLIAEAKRGGRYDALKPFFRGGIWRNFLSRYEESNWMHKRMLALSRRLADLPEDRRTARMTDTLYAAQANDAYWHGLFGGLYLPHLRREVWRNLVALEAQLDAAAPRRPEPPRDADFDGVEELVLHTAEIQAVAKLDGHGALCEFDSFGLAHNFADTLAQREEHYYRKLNNAAEAPRQGEGIASAHDRVAFKHAIGPDDVRPDVRPRRMFLDTWWTRSGNAVWPEYRVVTLDAAHRTLRLEAPLEAGSVTKELRLEGRRLRAVYACRDAGPGQFSVEINLALPSCDGCAGRYILADGGIPCGFGQALDLEHASALTLDDRVLGGALRLTASAPLAVRGRPHFTVSQSEAGFERIMQAATLTLSWPPQHHPEVEIVLEVIPDR